MERSCVERVPWALPYSLFRGCLGLCRVRVLYKESRGGMDCCGHWALVRLGQERMNFLLDVASGPVLYRNESASSSD